MGFGQYSGGSYGRDLARGAPRQKQKRFVFGSHSNTAHVWAQQNEDTLDGRSSDGRMKFEGPTIYSYGSHFAIAHFAGTYDGQRVVLFNANGYSSSTGKHRSHVRGALHGLPLLVLDVPDLTAVIDPSAKWDKKKHKARLNSAMEFALERWARTMRALKAGPRADWQSQADLASEEAQARLAVKALKHVLGLRGALPRNPVKWSDDRAAKAQAARLQSKKREARALVLRPINTAPVIAKLGEDLDLYGLRQALQEVRNAQTRLRSARQTLGKLKAQPHLIKRASASLALLAPYEDAFKQRVRKLEREAAERADLVGLEELAEYLKTYEAAKSNPDIHARAPSWLYNVPLAAQRWATALRFDREELAEWLRVHVHTARWQVEVPLPAAYRPAEVVTPEQWRNGKGHATSTIQGVPSYSMTLLRRKGEKLETSRGAVVPWDHALKAFEVVQRCRATGRTYQRNGHTVHVGHFAIDRIDAEGNMTAGCHSLTFEEMEALAIREAPHALKPRFPLPVPA